MGIMLRWKIFNYMLGIDILRNYFPKYLGVLRGDIGGIGCPKDAQTPRWLRLLSNTTILVINVVPLLFTRWPHGSSQPSQYPT